MGYPDLKILNVYFADKTILCYPTLILNHQIISLCLEN